VQVVVEFDGTPGDENPLWVEFAHEVESLGGQNLRVPHPELGRIAVFDLPESADPVDALERLRGMTSVTAAELDATREAF
jgi:hypothetical protein